MGLFHDFFVIWMNQVIQAPELRPEQADELAESLVLLSKHGTPYEVIYMAACFALWQQLDRAELCFKVNEAGLRVAPQSWRLPMTQGFIDAFVLRNELRAAFFYQLAASRERSPDYVASVAQKLLDQEQVSDQEFLQTLEEMINIPGHEKLRQQLSRGN